MDVRLSRHLVVDLESGLIGGRREATRDALRHAGNEDTVAEPLPTLPRIMHCDNHPAVPRRAGSMEQLPLRQPSTLRMRCRDRRLVLLLCATSELMNDAIRHAVSSNFSLEPSFGSLHEVDGSQRTLRCHTRSCRATTAAVRANSSGANALGFNIKQRRDPPDDAADVLAC